MSSANPQDTVTVHIKTELQYDVDAQQPAFPSGSLSALAVTTSGGTELRFNVYYVNSGSVFSAYQDPTLATTGSPPWSVENMHFPSTTPHLVRAISIPSSSHDMVMVVTQDGLQAYIIEVGPRYPYWTPLPLPGAAPVTDCRLFITSGNVVNVAVMAGDGMYIADPTTVDSDGWAEDVGVRGAFSAGIASFAMDQSLGSSVNSSVFGYAVASAKQGLGFLTGGSYSLANPAILQRIDPGIYTSVCTAPFPNSAKTSKPLVFATDSTLNAYYFQIQDDGTFVKVPIFPGVKVQQLEAAIRTTAAEGTEKLDYRAEVFAMDPNGVIYHLESGYDTNAKVNQLAILNNGNYTVRAWRQSFAQISSGSSAITSTASPDGNAFLLSYSSSGGANSLNLINQDPDTTEWTKTPVTLPAATSSSTITKKSRVYYVEVTAMDGNRLPLTGRGVVISSTQYAAININGRIVVVDPNRTTTAVSNGSGRVSLTLDAPDGLGVPTFTLWVEGMDSDSVIDVKPNGSIQSIFATLDRTVLRAATNKDNPANPPLFPSTITDAQLDAAASSVKEVITIVDPGFRATNVPLDMVDPSDPSRRHLHLRTRPTIASTRKRNQRSLGHIRGKADHGVHITLRPSLKFRRVTSDQAHNLRKSAMANILGIDLSWGDLWETVKDGLYTIKSVLIDPVVDGITATVHLFKDAVEYVWNGLVNFVQKAYNVIGAIFESIGAAFQDLFGWLAYLLDWGDIKNTANEFQNIINGFPVFGQNLLGNYLPAVTRGGFAQAKAWLSANITAIETAMGADKVQTYDQDNPPKTAGLGDGQGLLDDLPSTATWLMNKIFNAANGDAPVINFSSATSTLDSLWDTFYGNAQTVGLDSDLKAAYQSVGNVLITFRDRGAFDATSWASLLEVVKAFIFVVLDIAELAALSLESVAAAALNFFFDIMNAPLDIPVISWIFQKLTGVELTIINTVVYIMAIPFTILYKSLGGSIPFLFSSGRSVKAADQLGLSPADGLTLAKGVMLVLNGLWTSAIDVVQGELAIVSKITGDITSTFFKRLVTGINITFTVVVFGFGGYPSIDSGSPANIAAWGVTFLPAFINIAYCVKFKGTRGPARDPVGQVLLTLTGVGQLAVAAWETQAASAKGWTPKSKASVTSAWFLPWTNLTRGLNSAVTSVDPLNAQFVILAQLIINLVSGLGAGIALIVSATASNTLLIDMQPARQVKKKKTKKVKTIQGGEMNGELCVITWLSNA